MDYPGEKVVDRTPQVGYLWARCSGWIRSPAVMQALRIGPDGKGVLTL